MVNVTLNVTILQKNVYTPSANKIVKLQNSNLSDEEIFSAISFAPELNPRPQMQIITPATTANLGTNNAEVKIIYSDGSFENISVPVEVVASVDGTISLSPNDWTNTDVTATLTPNQEINDIPGWTKQDNGTFTKTFSANAPNESVEITSKSNGSSKNIPFSITKIDKVAPTCGGNWTKNPTTTTS